MVRLIHRIVAVTPLSARRLAAVKTPPLPVCPSPLQHSPRPPCGCPRLLATSLVVLLLLSGGVTRGQAPTAANGTTGLRLPAPLSFHRSLVSVGESATALQEGVVLKTALETTKELDPFTAADLFEAFVAENPQSVWTPSLHACLGEFWFQEGAYTSALDHWSRAWDLTKGLSPGPGKEVADYALAHWTRLLLGLGRLDDLEVLFAELGDYHLDAGPLEQKFLAARELHGVLKFRPSATYRGGWAVMNHYVRQADGQGLDERHADAFYREANLFEGCSFNALVQMAQTAHQSLVGVERAEGVADLPIPGVMHLHQNHFIAMLGWENGFVRAYDPLWGERSFRPEVLNAEASGRFLVASDTRLPAGWRQLTTDEMAMTLGRCSGSPGWFGAFLDSFECILCSSGCGGPGGAGGGGSPGGPAASAGGGGPPPDHGPDSPELHPDDCSGGGCLVKELGDIGMPHWSVTEPNINLWLVDQPIRCQPACGPPVGLQITFKQRDVVDAPADVFSLGPGWGCNWLSWVDLEQKATYGALYGCVVVLYLPGRGTLQFEFAPGQTSTTEYFYNAKLTAVLDGESVTAFWLDLPDGRRFHYGQGWSFGAVAYKYLYLTQSIDAQGFVTHYQYRVDASHGAPTLLLDRVTDHTESLLFTPGYSWWTTGGYGALLASATDRFGSVAQLTYVNDASNVPHLTTIRDTANLTSSVTYSAEGWPQTITTPYGTTTFNYQCVQDANAAIRRVDVTEPDGGAHIYLFGSYVADWGAPEEVPSGLRPDYLPTGTLLDYRGNEMNSYYWDPKQSVDIPVDCNQLTAIHLNKARLRHWLDRDSTDYYVGPDLALAYERSPSQDATGTTPGQITWFDHAGKDDWAPWVRGTQIEPKLIARKLPDGSTWYESYIRNAWGWPTSKTTTYGTGNPAPTRTYTYTYYANGQDIYQVKRPGNQLVASFTYNGRHQVLRTRERIT